MPFQSQIKCCIMNAQVSGLCRSSDLQACFFCPINGKSPCQATLGNVNGFICQEGLPLIYSPPPIRHFSCKTKRSTGQNIDLPAHRHSESLRKNKQSPLTRKICSPSHLAITVITRSNLPVIYIIGAFKSY